MRIYRDLGLMTLKIGKLYISNGWACSKDWKTYYKNKRPWRKWSRNPIFKSIAYENDDRTCTVFLGFIFLKVR